LNNMNLEQLVSIYTGLIGTAHPLIWLVLGVDSLLGDCIGISLPYFSETTWLLSGYLVGSHAMPIVYLLPMLIATQVGRLGGTWLFYCLANKGSQRLFRRFPSFERRLETSRLTQKLNKRHWSVPFWISLGRLFWLKYPINLLMATKKRFRSLAAGVFISGVIYDSTYIFIGAVIGKNLTLNPVQVLPYFIIGLTVSFVLTLAGRQLWKFTRALSTKSDSKAINRDLVPAIKNLRIMGRTSKQSEAENPSL